MHHSWFGLAMWAVPGLCFFGCWTGTCLTENSGVRPGELCRTAARVRPIPYGMDYLVESVKKPVSFIIMLIFFQNKTATNLMLSVNVKYYMNWLQLNIVSCSFFFVGLFYGLVNVIYRFLGVTSRSKSKLTRMVPMLGETLSLL